MMGSMELPQHTQTPVVPTVEPFNLFPTQTK